MNTWDPIFILLFIISFWGGGTQFLNPRLSNVLCQIKEDLSRCQENGTQCIMVFQLFQEDHIKEGNFILRPVMLHSDIGM